MRTLYLCYFGLREPLVQTQVLPYLRQISAGGIGVNLLTFEPHQRRRWSLEETEQWRDRLQADGIRWFSLPYHKRPSLPATLYDIVMGAWNASQWVRRYSIDVLHARGHVPMVMALLVQRWTGCRLVFDCRGLIAEEYVDAGIWRQGSLPFRLVKQLERVGFQRADQVVVLTSQMRAWLLQQDLASAENVQVIPCCVDFSRFAGGPATPSRPGADRFEVVYAGSVTGLYLLEEMAHFFVALRARQPKAFLRILTPGASEDVAVVLQRLGLNPGDFCIDSVRPADVPIYLRRACIGLSFRKPTFSQIAASPTKIAEYLAAGLPVVCNAGIGDMDGLLEQEQVGVVMRGFDQAAYAEAAEKILTLITDPALHGRCTHAARQHFDLGQVGGLRYRCLYDRLSGRGQRQLVSLQVAA